MPRLTISAPKNCKHEASGQAVVTLAGRDHYLGPYGTEASKGENGLNAAAKVVD